MAKAGRKPKEGQRYPSGKLKPEPPPVVKIRRAVELALRDADDPRLGYAMGRRLFDKKITELQFASGDAYAKLRGRFDRGTLVPKRTAHSPSYGDVSSPTNGDMLSEESYIKIVQRHTELLVFVGSRYQLLERACIDEGYIAEFEMPNLRASLDLLAIWFGLAS